MGVHCGGKLLVDYLGAADTAYTRAVARKMMVAAVARVYRPGVKFDSVVVLNGPQGMGKSSFFARLGGRWFSDSFTIGDMKDKAAPEKLLPEDWDRMDLSERRGFLRGDPFTGGSRTGTVRRTVVSAVEIWAECFGKEPTAIRRSDTYDIFGMLMKIGGWEKYGGNKNASLKRAFYGTQRCFVREEEI